MNKRFSDEQTISILREAEAGVSARELCRKHAISDATFYTLCKKFGGMEVPEVKTRLILPGPTCFPSTPPVAGRPGPRSLALSPACSGPLP